MPDINELFRITRDGRIIVRADVKRAVEIWVKQQIRSEELSDYIRVTISLADSRSNRDQRPVNDGEGTGTAGSVIHFTGRSFQVYEMTPGATATVRIGRRRRDALPLQEGKGFEGFLFDELIIENTAQPGASMSMIIIPRSAGLLGGD